MCNIINICLKPVTGIHIMGMFSPPHKNSYRELYPDKKKRKSSRGGGGEKEFLQDEKVPHFPSLFRWSVPKRIKLFTAALSSKR